METAILAGGCFWCTEAIFKRLIGVESVVPGYTGGVTKNPTYDEVCTGKTGHAEAIKIVFDKSKINYETILEVFFYTHDPTTLNKQGADIGTQYRSAIFYTNEAQKQIAIDLIKKLEKSTYKNIITEIKPADEFYVAEDYHKNYYDNNSQTAYCSIVISPKLHKLIEKYSKLLNNTSGKN